MSSAMNIRHRQHSYPTWNHPAWRSRRCRGCEPNTLCSRWIICIHDCFAVYAQCVLSGQSYIYTREAAEGRPQTCVCVCVHDACDACAGINDSSVGFDSFLGLGYRR